MHYRLHGVKNANAAAAPLIRLSLFLSVFLALLLSVKLLQPFLAPSFPADQLSGVLCYWVKVKSALAEDTGPRSRVCPQPASVLSTSWRIMRFGWVGGS